MAQRAFTTLLVIILIDAAEPCYYSVIDQHSMDYMEVLNQCQFLDFIGCIVVMWESILILRKYTLTY